MGHVNFERLKYKLLSTREFVSEAELARRCEVDRSTINRWLEKFPKMGIALERDDRYWVRIDRSQYPFDLQLDLNEAMAIFIACRLLARHNDKPNPHVISALTKLGASLKGKARVLGEHVTGTSERLSRKPTRAAREFVQSLETLTQAWADGVSVFLYTRKDPRQPRKFDPYFIEPTMYSLYVLGYDYMRRDIRTFKLQGLKRVSATGETFQVRAHFRADDYLDNAWGINWGKGKLETVRLRFTGNAMERVQDNVWHDSQEPPVMGDGWVELVFRVGDTLEMIPWIRQWGHECEVREPEALRKTIADHARKMAELYKQV